MKRLIKCIALIALGAVIVQFIYMLKEVHDGFQEVLNPSIRSDYRIRASIEDRIGSLPDSANHLYHANIGFPDVDDFIAFSASENDCIVFMQKNKNISMNTLKRVTNLTERVKKYGPGTWDSEYQDLNWNLTEETEILVYEDERETILYLPNKNRVFICLWGYPNM
ncbi:MAG: hypothetical protein ACYS1A_05155 [Planctomycetota bacterium]|jgi:hypothetical protein